MTDASARLMAPYRAVRRVSAGDGGPWPGLLVQLASGESRVLVDAGHFEPDWAGWAAPADGHVAAPLDLVRRLDGHDVMLPQCVERVEDFLTRRTGRRMPLSVGETVTLGVSLVRGFSEWQTVGQGSGEWWLTDGGRPVLACGVSDQDVAKHTAGLLLAMSEGSPCGPALSFAAEALSRPRVSPHDLREAEDTLFRLAAAEPLATSLLGPRSARELDPSRWSDRAAMSGSSATALDDEPSRASWLDGVARHVDADLADAVSRATTGVWRRLRARRAPGRRPWLVAGGVAATVLGVGLLWPAGAGGPAIAGVQPGATALATPTAAGAGSADSAGGEGTPAPDATSIADANGSASAAVPQPADLAAVTDGLLDARLACGADDACLSEVIVDPLSALPAGAIDLPAARRETTLLDDFGGVAVLRVESRSGGVDPQLVVIMLREDRWLLRDVHVAKQP